MKEVRDVTRKFFHLPYEEKLKIKMTPESGYRFGYLNMSNFSLFCLVLWETSDCLFSEGIKG